MSNVGDDLVRSMAEALAHARGEGPAVLHEPLKPADVRRKAKLTQVAMARLMRMSVSGYRKWEQGERRVSGPAETLLLVLDREPEAVKRALMKEAD